MIHDDAIDEAFRVRRAVQAEQIVLLQNKRELSEARRIALEDVRDRVVLPVLTDIEKAFERNGSPLEGSSQVSVGDTRAGGERRFQIPGRSAEQLETLIVSAVAVRSEPTADSFRVIAQVAERREQSDVYTFESMRDDSDTDSSLRAWTGQSLQRLVVERLRRLGL